MRYVEEFVRRRPRLRLSRDPFGNLLIRLRGGGRGARWVFTAHMDHPGFIARRMLGPTTLEADFRGGVRPDYFDGSKVRFFADDREIPGVVESHRTPAGERASPDRAIIRVKSEVPAACCGMWDQGIGRCRGGKFYSRVCDDLAGAAAALSMLDELSRRPPPTPVAVLLTRGEEEGFIGAIAAAKHPTLLKKSDRLIAIECSSMQTYAPQGAGAIIRVGDRTSVFNSSLSYFIAQQAVALAKADTDFKYQRALMPGGTCEATVYDVYGFTAASICVALGNYHNMDSVRKKIAPEFVDVSDWKNMVKLFIRIARTGDQYQPGHATLRGRLEKRFVKLEHLLQC